MNDARTARTWDIIWAYAGRVPLRIKIIGISIAAMASPCLAAVGWVVIRTNTYLSNPEVTSVSTLSDIIELSAVIFAASLVGLATAYLMTNVLTHPILQIARAAHLVESGDLTQRAPVWAKDEIGTLGRAFNSMIDALTRSQDELKRRDVMRTRLLAKSVTAQEQERERISRELHDETGQALTALLVQLKVLEHLPDIESVASHARELREVVVQLLDEVRRLARDLRPSTLDNLGLVPTLDWYIQSYARKTHIDTHFRARIPDGFRLPLHTELALYRVTQEALTNVARHADATRASVWLELDDDVIRLGVEDNGCGFDIESTLNSQDRSLGLLGIQERVDIIGGTFSLHSTAGKGTNLEVEVAVSPS
jgi:signal transduction histidine kinase